MTVCNVAAGVEVDDGPRVTGGTRKKPDRWQLPYHTATGYSCEPCGCHGNLGYYDYMLHLLRE